MNSHYLPKHDPYRGHSLIVNIIQAFSAIVAGFLVSLWGVWLIYTKKTEYADSDILLGAAQFGAVFLAVIILIVILVGYIAKLIICREKSGEAELIAESVPLEWKPVTDKMLEYLKRKRKFPWLSVGLFSAVIMALIISGAEVEIYAVILVFTALLCGALGFFICDDTAQCVSKYADFAVADVHHTFTKNGVKYAVVYLPEGERVFRMKYEYVHKKVKKLVFLSHLTNARLICDEEFISLID